MPPTTRAASAKTGTAKALTQAPNGARSIPGTASRKGKSITTTSLASVKEEDDDDDAETPTQSSFSRKGGNGAGSYFSADELDWAGPLTRLRTRLANLQAPSLNRRTHLIANELATAGEVSFRSGTGYAGLSDDEKERVERASTLPSSLRYLSGEARQLSSALSGVIDSRKPLTLPEPEPEPKPETDASTTKPTELSEAFRNELVREVQEVQSMMLAHGLQDWLKAQGIFKKLCDKSRSKGDATVASSEPCVQALKIRSENLCTLMDEWEKKRKDLSTRRSTAGLSDVEEVTEPETDTEAYVPRGSLAHRGRR